MFLFFLLLIFCSLCTDAFAESGPETAQNPFSLFVESAQFGEKNDGAAVSETGKTFQLFTSPSLSYVNGVLVVLAEAKKNDENKCDIVEGYFELKKTGNLKKAFVKETADEVWKKRLVVENDKNKFCFGSPTAVVNNTDIYAFFKNSSYTKDENFEYWVIDGNVDESKPSITWKTPLNLTEKFDANDFKDTFYVASAGAGIVVNYSLLVPVWYRKRNKHVLSLITNTSHNSDMKSKLALNNLSVEGKYSAIVEWGGKLIMMISCSDGYRKVYESDKMGTDWTEAKRHISGVWGNTEKRTPSEDGSRYGFITADIDGKGKKVILVTQPVKETKYKLHLWMTDYQRVSLA